jgi:hypothetical protein
MTEVDPNIAETCGGIWVSIMVYKTQFEVETDNLAKLYDDAGNQLAKIAGEKDRLQKGVQLSNIVRELDRLHSLLDEIRKASDRRKAALPGLRSWALNRATVPTRSFAVSKAIDAFGGDIDEAAKAGAISPMSKPAREVDLNIAQRDVVLNRRSDA